MIFNVFNSYNPVQVHSRSFLMLQKAFDESEGTPNLPASRWSKEGGVNAENPELPCPKGVTPIKPVKPPTAKPAAEKAPQQHMTCYVCGGLCTGVNDYGALFLDFLK